MGTTVYQENHSHSLSGGLLLRWRMGRLPHPSLTGTPMMMKTMVGLFAAIFIFHEYHLVVRFWVSSKWTSSCFVQTESGLTDVTQWCPCSWLSFLNCSFPKVCITSKNWLLTLLYVWYLCALLYFYVYSAIICELFIFFQVLNLLSYLENINGR